MKRWMVELFSNKYLRIALISVIAMTLIAFFGVAFLKLVGSRLPAETFSFLVAVFEIVIMTLGIVATISIIIMGIRLLIYGNEVKHDKTYWKIQSLGGSDKVMETQNDPYLLPVRLRNPIVPFILFLCCNIMLFLVVWFYFQVIFNQVMQIVIAFIVEYVMIVAFVIFVRLLRRFRPFRVKRFNNFR